jgi:hypothetical protein
MQIEILTLENNKLVFLSPPVAARRQVFAYLHDTVAAWLKPGGDRFLPIVSLSQLETELPAHYDLLESFVWQLNRVDRDKKLKLEELTWTDIQNLVKLTAKFLTIGEIPQLQYPQMPDEKPARFNPYDHVQSSGDAECDLIGDIWANGLGEAALDLYHQFDIESLLRINYRVRQIKYVSMPEMQDLWQKSDKREREIQLLKRMMEKKAKGN